jgi:hypothetical protein
VAGWERKHRKISGEPEVLPSQISHLVIDENKEKSQVKLRVLPHLVIMWQGGKDNTDKSQVKLRFCLTL